MSRELKILKSNLPAGTDPMDWTNGLAVGTLAICAAIIGRGNPSFPHNSPFYRPTNSYATGTIDKVLKRERGKLTGQAMEQKRSPSFVRGIEASFDGLWEIYLQ